MASLLTALHCKENSSAACNMCLGHHSCVNGQHGRAIVERRVCKIRSSTTARFVCLDKANQLLLEDPTIHFSWSNRLPAAAAEGLCSGYICHILKCEVERFSACMRLHNMACRMALVLGVQLHSEWHSINQACCEMTHYVSTADNANWANIGVMVTNKKMRMIASKPVMPEREVPSAACTLTCTSTRKGWRYSICVLCIAMFTDNILSEHSQQSH